VLLAASLPFHGETKLTAHEATERLADLKLSAAESFRARIEGALWSQAQIAMNLPSAIATTDIGSYVAHLNAQATYETAYVAYVHAQTLDLAHARSASFEREEAACADVFEAIGDSYVLSETWMACPSSDGVTFPVVVTTSGTIAGIDELQLYPFSVPKLDLSSEPPEIAAVLDLVNTDPIEGFHFSARIDGTLRVAGIATMVTNASGSMLLIRPDTVDSPTSVVSAADTALGRGLDAALGGLDWDFVFALLHPAYQPPKWDPTQGSNGVASQGDPCAEALACIAQAEQAYDQAMKDALARHTEKIRNAFRDFSHTAAAIEQSRQGIRALFQQAGQNGLVGGGTREMWETRFDGYDQDNLAKLKADLQDAKTNLRNEACNAAKARRQAILNCIANCPALLEFLPIINQLLSAAGCV